MVIGHQCAFTWLIMTAPTRFSSNFSNLSCQQGILPAQNNANSRPANLWPCPIWRAPGVGFSARQRKDEVERLNEQLRKINLSLRQQAKAGTIYAPGLNYAPPPTFKKSEGGTFSVMEPMPQQPQPTLSKKVLFQSLILTLI